MDDKRKEYLLKYEREKIKRIPFSIQLSEYETLKEQADAIPMNTYIKNALNAYSGVEIFKV